MANIKATQTSSSDDWETPSWLIREIEKRFGKIDLDPCATESNSKGVSYIGVETDGLKQSWSGNVFVNPPYSQATQWIQKSYEEAASGRCQVVMLVAARPDTKYWWDYVRKGTVYFLKGRLVFTLSEENRELVRLKNIERRAEGKTLLDPEHTSAPFPSAVVHFSRGLADWPSTTYWDLPKELRR